MYIIEEYDGKYQTVLIDFLKECLPESGRTLDLEGRHRIYLDIYRYFECFWIMIYHEKVIGMVGIRKLNDRDCELKSLYLFSEYQGKGLGYKLLQTAIDKSKKIGYNKMYLDTLSTSKRAVALYQRAGFVMTERYNNNKVADVFMVLDISKL